MIQKLLESYSIEKTLEKTRKNTLSSMESNDEKVKFETCSSSSSIENLPLLVMTKIFGLLSINDRESAMRVCVRWYRIVKFEVGRTVFIGNELVYNFPGHKLVKWKSINLISKVGIDKCLFAEVLECKPIDYSIDNEKDEHSVKGFMLPHLVKELAFYGQISKSLFQVIMTPIHWLTSLKIHLSVFRLVSFENYTLRLGCLSRLRIFYTHPVFHLSFPFKEDDPMAKAFIHKNLTQFLSTCFFRRIQIFEFLGPYFVDETENLVDAVRAFVTRHQVSLKELALSFPYEWNVSENKESQEISNEFALSASSLKADSGIYDWGNVQLRRFQVVCPATIVPPISGTSTDGQIMSSSWAKQSFNGLWRSLLGKQCNISSIQYVNKYEDWSFPQAIFANNANTLKMISLSVNANFDVDCTILSCCKNLGKLVLEGNYFHDDNAPDFVDENNNNFANYAQGKDREEGSGKLFNAHLLPESLQEICLSKLAIPVTEVEALVNATMESKRFPNLGSLQLYQICKGLPQFGLTVAAVNHLFDQSSLSVSFWQALNCTSFECAIRKALNKTVDSDVMTLMKVLEYCDTEEGEDREAENLRFSTLYDCHVQLIRKPTHNIDKQNK